MTLKYPKKAIDKANLPRRTEKLSEISLYPEQHPSSWSNAPHHSYPNYHTDYNAQFVGSTEITTVHYSPEYYSAKPPSTVNGKSGRTVQLPTTIYTESTPPDLLTNHQMENCDWPSSATKPVELTYLVVGDENNNSNVQQPWLSTTAPAAFNHQGSDIKLEHCQNNGGAISTNASVHSSELSAIPSEFVNYDQHTGFPPSISSNASTLSSPTTSTDYNFNYQFDTFNSSMSNDAFDSYQPQMDTYTGYEAMMPVDSNDVAYQPLEMTPSSCQWAATEIYEPNYYPFANGIEKMIY